ncbi:MAG: UDP-glucose 4-epimerase GalE [Moraxella sp.]|jgi:UDP-glucose 4-epimerase|uniref:UDP-glucose 4-epimerase n=1 Tax=Faucicola osloensis TaxID=34062 RepID=A0A6P1KE19_FAUOS|nr:UDP-glucose 4-epimerase GalE [Moraxella osloensis]MBP6340862.1 UDP-glucose 4-epimerase GalE [Moraxella sp.]MBP6484743.1 UDP-glucose 4-epimerase GalE [Moraxella sp.]MBP7233831.1 UDP-glucose 4-epimerase GalE [Moraxella sp.]QHG10228.1 UDP-glucose 4-epimerase GalE [Moraxella osloensis]
MTNQSKKILVTGGAGYIGSHTLIELIAAGFTPVVYDNLSNSSPASLARVQQIVGQSIEFIEGDILDTQLLAKTFAAHDFTAVIHFAGLKAVGESVAKPLWYYQNNVAGTLNLLDAMTNAQVKNLIFSSSATVYGDPEALPIVESSPRSATNPYGQSKLMIEYMLEDLAKADSHWQLISLRYFNPIGAHHTGTIGENPNGIPNNLMPYVSQVAVGKLPQLSVFGNDYDTVDGTGVRDYIHVVDLAKGHVAALQYLEHQTELGFEPINLGTGKGTSVLELVNAFIKTTGQPVPYSIAPRRPGDIASCYASSDKAKHLLGWQAQFDIERMCADTWRWQSQNPNGYDD